MCHSASCTSSRSSARSPPGFGLALVFGYLASRLRAPPLVGYLVAGILIGPATPGFVADMELTTELAEIGVMLMMFGVGLHFSIRDLMAVQRIAIPGAIVQIAAATVLASPDRPSVGLDLGREPGVRDSRSRWRAPWCCSGRSRRAGARTR